MAVDDTAERTLDAERALAELYPRVLELEVLLHEARDRDAAIGLQLDAAEATIAALRDELADTHAELLETEAARRLAEHHLDLLLRTKVMRAVAVPRSAYRTYLDRRRTAP